MTPIEQIYQFNLKAGLLEKGYNDALESSFQIEEALEGFDNTKLSLLLKPYSPIMGPKGISRELIKIATWDDKHPLSDVDRLDKAADAVVFGIGSMAKLRLNPEQIVRVLTTVMTANLAKLDYPKDEMGKLTKPANFNELYAPEPKLQAILDERP